MNEKQFCLQCNHGDMEGPFLFCSRACIFNYAVNMPIGSSVTAVDGSAAITGLDLNEVTIGQIGRYPVHFHHLHEDVSLIEKADEPVFLEAAGK